MKQTDKALDKNRPGQEQGLSFWQCFARNRLYSRDLPGLRPYLYIIPFFLAYLVLDFSLRFTYRGMGIGSNTSRRGCSPWAGRWFSRGWCSSCPRCPGGLSGACPW